MPSPVRASTCASAKVHGGASGKWAAPNRGSVIRPARSGTLVSHGTPHARRGHQGESVHAAQVDPQGSVAARPRRDGAAEHRRTNYPTEDATAPRRRPRATSPAPHANVRHTSSAAGSGPRRASSDSRRSRMDRTRIRRRLRSARHNSPTVVRVPFAQGQRLEMLRRKGRDSRGPEGSVRLLPR